MCINIYIDTNTYMSIRFFFFIKKAKDTNTEGLGDSVKCWPCKYEDSSSNLRIHRKIQDMMALACTPSGVHEHLWGTDEQPVWPNW